MEICAEILPRGLLQRFGQQSSYRDLLRDLARRPLIGILYRDLVKRAEILYRDLAQRSCSESLNRDLPLRSLTEIFCGDIL